MSISLLFNNTFEKIGFCKSLFVYFRIFNEFLMTNERHVAKEVRDEYVDTMSKVYYSYFKSYSSRLMKLQVPCLAVLLVSVLVFLFS